MSKKPVLLCIMDGFGWTPNETYGNAVAAANKPFIDSLMAKYPMTTICLLYTSPSPRDCS